MNDKNENNLLNDINEEANNSNEIDYIEIIKKEWQVNNLADVEVNLTTSSYRKSVYGDTRPPAKRHFVSSVSIENDDDDEDEKDYSASKKRKRRQSESELTKQDEKALEWRINSANTKFNAILSMLDVMFNLYRLASPSHQQDQQAWDGYNELKNQINQTRANEERLLREFFRKGQFKKGHFHKYKSYVMCQPGARRRRYGLDDGYRTIIAHDKTIKNIFTEERIYHQYYGIPITD